MGTGERLAMIEREGANADDAAWMLAIARAAWDLCDLANGTRGVPTTGVMGRAWVRLRVTLGGAS